MPRRLHHTSHSSSESGLITVIVILGAVTLATLLFATGLIIYLIQGGAIQPFRVHSIAQLFLHAFRDMQNVRARGFIEAGLIVLLLGPLLRLGAGVLRSTRGGDWRFALIGIVVALILVAGIVLGTSGG